MPKIHEMIESKYLRKEDVEGEALVTIQKVGQVNVAMEDQPEEKKWAMKFAEYRKPMVLNSTNIQLIAKATGADDTDQWAGKKVVLYVDDNVTFGGKLIGGLRIKPFREPQQPKPPTQGGSSIVGGGVLEDDIPF